MSTDVVPQTAPQDDKILSQLSVGDWTVLRELHLSDCEKCGKLCRAILMPADNAHLGQRLGLISFGKVYRDDESTYSWLTDAGKAFMRRAVEKYGFAGPPA